MPDQLTYYNNFGKLYAQSILACAEPEFWTTDYSSRGRVYREISQRVRQQESLVLSHFSKDLPVLDIGCGFGRQAIVLARAGFQVEGIDPSSTLIGIAKKLCEGKGYNAKFFVADLLDRETIVMPRYGQAVMFDVLEHIKPASRKLLVGKLASIMEPHAKLIITLPHVRSRLSSRLNNSIRKAITQYIPWFFRKEEHPYPIPRKAAILRLTKKNFDLAEMLEKGDTDYYVFERK